MSARRVGSVVGGAGTGGAVVGGVGGGVGVGGVGKIIGVDGWAATAVWILASMVSLAILSLLISDRSDSRSRWCLVSVSVIVFMIPTLLSRSRLSCSVRSLMVSMSSAVFVVEVGSSLVKE